MSTAAAPAADPLAGFRLDGRTALVTGAGRGLGRSAALLLGAAGAEVIAVSRTPADLAHVADEIRAGGGRCTPLAFDVTDAAQVHGAFERIATLDVLVNNAGGNIPEPFVDVTEAHLDHLLSLNVRSVFLVAQGAVRKMRESPDRRVRGGVIVNMSSQMGHVGAAGRTVYCMTKHAVEGLTKALAVELAPEGIRVNAVAPTFIETPMTAPFFANEAFRRSVVARVPLGRLGTMDEVAAAILFLASPAASLVTGTSLLVDGGWTAQ